MLYRVPIEKRVVTQTVLENSCKKEAVSEGLVTIILTSFHVSNGLAPDLGRVQASPFQVLEDKNIWREVDHVLLPTAIRHGKQVLEIVKYRTHDISYSAHISCNQTSSRLVTNKNPW